MIKFDKHHLEYLRIQAKQKFENSVKESWIQCGKWALPNRTQWLAGEEWGQRNNQHIVDTTHIIALRSYVAGFLEGNTSASRYWARIMHSDPEINKFRPAKEYLDTYTRRVFTNLGNSNFYHAAGMFYYELGTFNTSAYYIDEVKNSFFFHNLEPGSYYCLNNQFAVANILIREFELTVKAVVEKYGTKKDGKWDWSNFSSSTRKMYEDGNYTQKVSIVHIVIPNEHFDPNIAAVGSNRQWASLTYEVGNIKGGQYYQNNLDTGVNPIPAVGDDSNQLFLKVKYSKRKPFIVGRSDSGGNFEYGLKGPTLDALGSIKSLNKKAIGKDIALDQMLKPTLQGPASLKKSYITNAPNAYIPLDALSMQQGGLKAVNQINPAIAALNQDVGDLRDQVSKLYYADYLLYLTRNPKTRTAREVDAVVQEQQLIIGPNLQSLNWTHNNPVLDFVMDWTLHEDPYMPEVPEVLQGEFLRTEMVSVFAQAQKAADLPVVDRYMQMIMNVGQIDPSILKKANLDKLADIYEDRLYLPPGLNRDQAEVDAERQQQEAMAQRQQVMTETIPAMAGAARDISVAKQNKQ